MCLDPAGVEKERAKIAADWGAQADRIAEGSLLCTPADATEHIMSYVDNGADAVNIALRAPWDAEALDAYLDHVMPAVRAAANSA